MSDEVETAVAPALYTSFAADHTTPSLSPPTPLLLLAVAFPSPPVYDGAPPSRPDPRAADAACESPCEVTVVWAMFCPW